MLALFLLPLGKVALCAKEKESALHYSNFISFQSINKVNFVITLKFSFPLLLLKNSVTFALYYPGN